jgi:adenylate kinase
MSPTFSSLNLVFLGPHGSGKDTQAEVVANAYSIAHISTRELLLEQVRQETFRGGQIRHCLDKDQAISDRLLAGLVLERLDRDDCARGFLLTGYPANLEQVGTLDGILAELGRVIERVVYFDVSDDVVLARRGQLSPEEDFSAATVRRELAAYRRSIRAVVELYLARGLLMRVDGDRPVDHLTTVITQAVGMPVGA